MERVLEYVRVGREEGARVVTGGERILEETGGWFVPPTIFDGVRNDMTIAREEIFGPVLSVIEFETEAEAVAIANDTPYGLAASLYTEDLNVAHRVARELRAGVVGVNAYSEGDMTTPFGGYKLSGFGGHDKSVHAHDQYTETKTIWIQLRAGRSATCGTLAKVGRPRPLRWSRLSPRPEAPDLPPRGRVPPRADVVGPGQG